MWSSFPKVSLWNRCRGPPAAHVSSLNIGRRTLSSTFVDEIGYMTMRTEQANAFFRLMEQRYNRVSTIITTNLEPQSDWHSLFQNKSLVDALLDRLQHHCITIRINGPSLRSKQSGAEPEAAEDKAAHKKRSGAHPRIARWSSAISPCALWRLCESDGPRGPDPLLVPSCLTRVFAIPDPATTAHSSTTAHDEGPFRRATVGRVL